MPGLIELIIGARDATGAAFGSARSNLAGLGSASERTTRRVRDLSERIRFQERDLAILGKRITATKALTGDHTLAIERQSNAYDKLNASIRRNKEEAGRLGSGGGVGNAIRGGVGGAFGALGIGLGVAAIGQQIGQLTGESAQLAVQAERIGAAYEEAAQRAGVSGDVLLKKLKETSRGTVAEVDLQLSANKALGLGVGQSIQEVADLMAIARQRGKAFGVSTEEAFQRIVEGLGKAEPEILDELGILVDANLAYKEYAKAHNVSTESLTKQQKVMIITNEVLAKNNDLVEKNKTEVGDAADRAAQATVRLTEAERAYGEKVLPLYLKWLQAKGDIAQMLVGGNAGLNGGAAQSAVARMEQSSTSYADFQQKREAFIAENALSLNPARLLAAAQMRSIKVSPGQYAKDRRALQDTIVDPDFTALFAGRTASTTAMPTRSASFGPYANTLSAPARANIYVTVQGSLVHTGDVVDGIMTGMQQKERRSGFNETRGRR